jgi:hypothetical protein
MGRCHRVQASLMGAAAAAVGLAAPADARITRIEINKVESPAYAGATFGAVGAYERLDGTAYGEVDPRSPQNAIVQDIALAPRNARGMVEYSMDVQIFRPLDKNRGNGTLLYDAVNRGNLTTIERFNIGRGAPGIGDGFLQAQGFSIVASGWQPDLLQGGGRLTMKVPVARNADGSAITGRVRMEYNLTELRNTQTIGARGSSGYDPVTLDTAKATLTARVHQNDPRIAIASDQWAFADCSKTPFPGAASPRHVCLKDGFDTNHIYELIYDAKDPTVLGLGFAATRDLTAFLHHNANAADNPLAGAVRNTLFFGSSQSGRFGRGLLSLGFNQDEDGRIVFEGLYPHTATARIALNLRFGQPGRDAGLQHIERHYPGTEAPVTWSATPDPITGEPHGLLDRCTATKTCPKIVQTVSDTEYWQRGMTLITGDAAARRDLAIPDNVRIYHLAGAQHGGSQPGRDSNRGICQMLTNSHSYHYPMRALLLALRDWIVVGKEPPASRYPTFAAKTLLPPDVEAFDFPKIPGVKFTAMYNPRTVFERGAHYNVADLSGVMAEPPKPTRELPVLMPKVDRDGNPIDGVRSAWLQAPLGTYTGWNYRAAGFGEGDLCDNNGGFIPFAATKAERQKSGDPRLSLEERYGSHDGYVAAVKAAAERQVRERFMRPEDVAGAAAIAQASKVLQ